MKPTLLVVEDELLLRMDLVDLANDAGFDTIEAGSAAEAIETLRTRDDVRAVFTDIRMPGDMDGLGLAHFVREMYPPTVIVICSANQAPEPSKLPASALFVPKPCSGPRIEQLLADIFAELS